MASLASSIMTKVDALTATNFPASTVPNIYLNTAPQVQSLTQLRPPFLILELVAGTDDLTFESDSIEETKATLTAFYLDQGQADQAIKAVRFNGQTVENSTGLEFGTLPALTEGTLLSIEPVRPPIPAYSGFKDKDGKNVYKTTMEWTVSVQRT